MMTSCREQAISHAAAAYADFLQYGPNANPDPFFLPNVFSNDTDEVYPVANWWLCGSPPSHSPVHQLPLNHGAAGQSELSRVHCGSPSQSPVGQVGSLPKPFNCRASPCTNSGRTSSGSRSQSPGRRDGSSPTLLNYEAAGPSELSQAHSFQVPGRQDGTLPTPLSFRVAGPPGLSRLAIASERREDSRCTSPTVAPSTVSTEGRRRRSRRPGSTSSSVSASTVATFRTMSAGRTDGGVGNGLAERAGSSSEQGEHGFRRGSGRSFSTPRFRTVSENGDSIGEATARRGSEDDGALVRMRDHQELKNLLRAYQSSFLTSYGRCAPLNSCFP